MSETVPATARPPAAPSVRVWDLPVRLFHWTLVALMVLLFASGEVMEDAMQLHQNAGLALLALVMFRILWGFVGSTYARFGQFLRGPVAALRYARSMVEARPHFVAGHNPLGGWMVVGLLLLLPLQVVLGLFSNDDIMFEGPLASVISKEASDLITGLHEDLFHVLLVMVVLHVAAVVWHKLFKGENLVIPMFTGRKALPPGEAAEETKGGNPLLAAAILAVCAAAVYMVLL